MTAPILFSSPATHGKAFAMAHPCVHLRHNRNVPEPPQQTVNASQTHDYRLRKHAEYQRVYREGRKQFSTSMSYFFAVRGGEQPQALHGPRVGLTAGKVLGKAVERNRIKRRLREIVRRHAVAVRGDVDIVLHPRRSVLTMEFARLESEVARIFTTIQTATESGRTPLPSPNPRATRPSA
jgi:ribonuclease P protein component